jgi:NADH:ubiquinone oxidoreductase subunit 6 (subunit J)
MRTRRILLFAALLSISTSFVLAMAEPTGVLEVTNYYLPG